MNNLKGESAIQHNMGGDFYRNTDGYLCYSVKTYIERMESTFKKLSHGTRNQEVYLTASPK